MTLPDSPLSDSCEDRLINVAISSSAKILIFRKSRKFFWENQYSRRYYEGRKATQIVKAFEKNNLRKSDFSQMFLYQKVKERCNKAGTDGGLNDSNLHWVFLLDGRYVLDSGKAFCAERIDVHPVLATHNDLAQPLTH